MGELENRREYCILGLENIKGLKDDIISIAIGSPKFIDNESMCMSVFYTQLTPVEMKSVFNSNRSYFLFELDPGNAMVNIIDKKMHDFVFKNFKTKEQINKLDSPNDLFKTIFNSTMGVNIIPIDEQDLVDDSKLKRLIENLANLRNRDGKTDNELKAEKEIEDNKYNEEELNTYSIDAKHDLINEILEKGTELTDKDKSILKILTNKK